MTTEWGDSAPLRSGSLPDIREPLADQAEKLSCPLRWGDQESLRSWCICPLQIPPHQQACRSSSPPLRYRQPSLVLSSPCPVSPSTTLIASLLKQHLPHSALCCGRRPQVMVMAGFTGIYFPNLGCGGVDPLLRRPQSAGAKTFTLQSALI